MFDAFTTQLAWVICFMIVVGGLLTAGAGVMYMSVREAQIKANPKKRTVIPQKAYAQPGICMCDDAFNFHIDGKRCNVEGCPCVVFVPSDAEDEVLKEIGLVGMSRMAIEGVNSQLEWRKKQEALETLKSSARVAQIGPFNKGGPCEECGSKGNHQRYCSQY